MACAFAAAGAVPGSTRLGADLWRSARALLIGGAAIFAGILLVDFAVAQYQELGSASADLGSQSLRNSRWQALRARLRRFPT
jgi:hypothetical protein